MPAISLLRGARAALFSLLDCHCLHFLLRAAPLCGRFFHRPARDAEAPSCTLTAGASSPRATGLLLSAGWIVDGSALWRGVQSSGCERISPMKMLGCGVADVSPLPACMHSIEPGLGILSARKGEEGAGLSLWRWNGGIPFSYVRSPNPQTPPAPSCILQLRSIRSKPL